MRKRAGWLLSGLAVFLVLATAAVVRGDHNDVDAHSDNMTLLANYDDGGTYRTGTDLAFWGDLMIAGNLDQGIGPNASPPGGFRVMDISKPSEPREIGQFVCWGDQSDVSVFKNFVVLSVDKPTTVDCSASSGNWEGVRVIDISNPKKPSMVGSVRTDCGSHTNTMLHDTANNRLIVYVLSYPLAGRYNPAGAMPTCNAASHRKFSVVEVPLTGADRGVPKLLRTVPLETNIGCHDVTLFLERNLAGAACLTESQLWDISDPASPRIVDRIPNPPGLNLSHSTTFSNDGKTLVVGDELGGAAASPGCLTGSEEDEDDVLGGLFFFDVENVESVDTPLQSPKHVATYKLPRQVASEFCTAHQFNVVPLKDERDILVSSWYTGATSVIEFTDVREIGDEALTEIAHYIPAGNLATPDSQPTEAAAWASYWYRGHVWSSNFDEDVNSVRAKSRGIDVFKVDHEAVAGALDLPRLNPQVQEPLP